MKVFISQPMRGKTDEEIIDVRCNAIRTAKGILGTDIEVIDSFFQGAPTAASPLSYLGESIKLLGEADFVVFCPGWREARGCLVEHEVAVEYGIDFVEVV